MLRTHVILSVFRRNFWSYFSGVIGYLFIVAFVLAGALLAFREEFFSDNVASLDKLNAYFPHLLLFIIPAITMGVWSEEKKLGTDELLFTLPVSDLEVLLGKYLSVVAVYSVVLLFSLTNTVVLQFIGDPDWGLIAATYLGYWLAGCALLSAGMAASFLTNSTTVAFVLGTLVCAVPVFIGNLPVTRPLASEFPTNILGQAWFYLQSIPGLLVNEQIVRNLSIPYHFEQFARGFFPLTAVFYFVSFAAFFLYVNLVLIGERHWAGGVKGTNMGWQYLVRAVSVLLLLISTNAVLANIRWQPDLTSERLYTLTGTTTDLLRNIPEKRPVTVQAFVSRNVPRDYISVRTLLLGMLQQYESHSGGRVTVRIVEVDPFSEQAEEARKYGIEPRKVQSERGGRVQVDDVFLGSVISSGANEVVVPFFDTAIPVEYELTRSIRTVTNESRRTVGILETDAKIAGGFDMSSFRSNPEWRIVTELRKQYNVETVSPTAPIDDTKFDVLVAVLPSSLDANGMAHLVDYVKKGKPTLIFDDPLPAWNPGAAPRQPKPRQGGMMGQMPPEQKADGGKATSLVNLLGIQWVYDQVAWSDTIMLLHPEHADVVRPEIVSISRKSGTAKAFHPDDEVTGGLQELLLFFAGTIQNRQNSQHNFTPLLLTGKTSGLIDWDELVQPSFFGGVDIRENPTRPVDEYTHVCAARITADGKSGGDKLNVIYVADSDLISDWFFFVRERRLYGLDLDNVTFVLNAVDSLAGDRDNITLRKRRPKHRSLTAVENAVASFVDQSAKERQKASADAKAELERAKERFREKVEKIQKDTSLDELAKAQQLAIAQSEEQRRVEVEEARIEQEKQKTLDEIKARTQRQVRQIEHRFFALATIFPAIPALALGLLVWLSRSMSEQRDVPPARRRSGR